MRVCVWCVCVCVCVCVCACVCVCVCRVNVVSGRYFWEFEEVDGGPCLIFGAAALFDNTHRHCFHFPLSCLVLFSTPSLTTKACLLGTRHVQDPPLSVCIGRVTMCVCVCVCVLSWLKAV